MKVNCVLCGTEIGSYNENWSSPGEVAYFERGLSTNRYLCRTCREHKTVLMDLEAAENAIIASEEYMKKYADGKVSEIRSVVQAWIDGECKNYFPEMQDLVYYAEGPEAYLFVFKDRAIVLSSVIEGLRGKTNINYDAAMLFSNGENASAFAIFDDKENNIGEAKKIACKPDANGRYGDAQKRDAAKYQNSMEERLYPRAKFLRTYYTYERAEIYTYTINKGEKCVHLEKSWGEYGSLNFNYQRYSDKVFSFKFFYHQNQLMEEIYNYMKRQISFEGKEEETANSSGPVQIMSSRRKTMESREKAEGASFSLADEIGKLKSLLDCGAITQEEFETAKKLLFDKA